MVAGELEAIFISVIVSCKFPMFQYVIPPLMLIQHTSINLSRSQSKVHESKMGVWAKEERIQGDGGRLKNVVCVEYDQNISKCMRLSKNKHKFKIIFNSKYRYSSLKWLSGILWNSVSLCHRSAGFWVSLVLEQNSFTLCSSATEGICANCV